MPAAAQQIHFGFRPAEISALVNAPVIAEHASEAAFLWFQQGQAQCAPHFRLDRLAIWHERLQAHLDGLQVAGAAGWRAALDGLATGEAGAVFTAAWLAFGTGHREGMRHVVALADAAPDFADAIVSALGWLPWTSQAWSLARLASSAVPAHRRIAVAARSAHLAHTVESLTAPLQDEDAGVRAQALKAVGRQRLTGLRDAAQAAYQSDRHRDCRFAAAVALALLHERGPALRAWDLGLDSPALRREGLEIAMRLGSPAEARQLIRTLAAGPATKRAAVLAVGAFGDPAAMSWLIECCGDPELAPAAGEAISTITGLDLDAQDLSTDPPSRRAEAEAEDNGDDDESGRHVDDALLPYPDRDALSAWWQGNAGAFAAGKRYLAGEPISAASIARVLRDGYQRQRAAAALELCALAPDRPLFDTGRRADLQLAELRP